MTQKGGQGDIEEAKYQDDAGSEVQPQLTIELLHKFQKEWEEEGCQRREAAESEHKSHTDSDQRQYFAAMKDLQAEKHCLEVVTRHLSQLTPDIAKSRSVVLERAKIAWQRRNNARARLFNEIEQTAIFVYKCRQLKGSPSKVEDDDKSSVASEDEWCRTLMSGEQTPQNGLLDTWLEHLKSKSPVQLSEETERLEINIEALENQEEEVKIQRSALVESLKPLKGRQAEDATKSSIPTRSWFCLYLPIVVLLTIGLGIGIAAGCMAPAVKTWKREDIAGHAGFVVPVYTLLVIPIGLYLTHDVIDKRWRPVRGQVTSLHGWALTYGVLSFVGLMLLISYAYVQFNAGAIDEGMAALVSCSIAIYGGYLCMRQQAILSFFTDTLQTTAKGIRVLGVEREWARGRPHTDLERILDELTPDHLERLFPGGPCYGKLSSALLDDNFPGDGPRVTWLSPDPEIIDKLELIARVGLWILLTVKPPTYSFAKTLRPNLGISALDIPVDLSSTNALWTYDLARLLFSSLPRTRSSNGVAGDGNSKYFLSDFRDLVEKTTMTGWEGVTSWVKPLNRIPISEWAQALAEHSSREVVDLLETTVAWEIILSLCSPHMQIKISSEDALIDRLQRIIQQFGVFGAVDVGALRPEQRGKLLEFEVRAKKWSLLMSECFEAYRANGVSTKQLREQAKRAEALDMLIAVTLMFDLVPARDLELDCKFFLTANNNITLLLHEREKHVVSILWGMAQRSK